MPAKAPIDENVKFLFACLIRSDYKTIDFTRVAADFSINPAAARMRWSRLKKTINVDNIASSVLDGKKRRMSKARRPSPPSPVKVEKVEDGASHLHSPPAPMVGIVLKEEEEVALPQELAPAALFAGLPKPPKCNRDRAEEQVSIPVADEAVGGVSRFSATQVPHLPRVAGAAAVEVPETKSQHPIPHKLPRTPVVQTLPTVKSEPKPQLGEEEEGKAVKSKPPSTDTTHENTGSTATAVFIANGSKKRKVGSA